MHEHKHSGESFCARPGRDRAHFDVDRSSLNTAAHRTERDVVVPIVAIVVDLFEASAIAQSRGREGVGPITAVVIADGVGGYLEF